MSDLLLTSSVAGSRNLGKNPNVLVLTSVIVLFHLHYQDPRSNISTTYSSKNNNVFNDLSLKVVK